MAIALTDRPAVPTGLKVLDLADFGAAPLATDPYPYVFARSGLRPEALAPLRRDFPDLRVAGFHPLEAFKAHGAFIELIEDLQGATLAAAMSEKFGLDFTALPQFITVRKLSRAHEGRVHNDSESKVASLLLYMNPGWTSPDGHIRVLRNKDGLEPFVAELSPEEGNIFAFLRGPNSWHGHTPFVGERRVVQVAWLRDAGEIKRKQRRHRLSLLLKRIFAA